MRAMFVCAGSGGHINPAIATADALRRLFPRAEILFVGAGRRMEQRLVPAAGYTLENIEISGLQRGLKPRQIMQNFNAAKLLLTATKRADSVIASFKPDVVMSTGNAVCYPVLRAANKRGIPTVLHESNAAPGLAAKTVSKFVTRVYTAFENTESLYKNPDVVRYLPTPVRGDFGVMPRKQARRELGIPDDAKLAVSFWGSQGGSGMNKLMREVIARNAKQRLFRQIHAVGGDEKRRADFVSGMELPREIDVRTYIEDMPRVMAAADLVVCRAGGSTVAELALSGRASVLVPSPYVPNDHQSPNAAAFEKAGAAVILREQTCTAQKLFDTIHFLLSDENQLHAMEQNARQLGSGDAAEVLATELMELI